MTRVNSAGRREFLTAAAAIGAVAMWPGAKVFASSISWRENRELFPQGVASGDPDEHSVILWTRRPFADRTDARLTVEIALDPVFHKVVATDAVSVYAEADWTARVLIGGLASARQYW